MDDCGISRNTFYYHFQDITALLEHILNGGKISNESPVGQALIGKKVGDTVSVETQAGEIKYKVLEISRSM